MRTNAPPPAPVRPLLSHSTILILSGFLIGMVAHNYVQSQAAPYVYLTGIVGLIAYLGLGQLARSRQKRAESLACERASDMLVQRLNRHVPRLLPRRFSGSRLHIPSSDQQYVPVPRSPRVPASIRSPR